MTYSYFYFLAEPLIVVMIRVLCVAKVPFRHPRSATPLSQRGRRVPAAFVLLPGVYVKSAGTF